MTPLPHKIAIRFAGEVVELRPKAAPGPKLTIGGKHYALSTDSGPLMGDLAEILTPEESSGGARVIHGPGGNKWRYLWAYDVENDQVAMWRASDGDEKLYDTGKHAGAYLVRLTKKGQLNRVTPQEFKAIDVFMKKRAHETLEELKQIVETNKNDQERQVDVLAKAFFEKHVVPLIEHQISDVKKGAIPFGFKPYDPKAEHSSIERQAISFIVGRTVKKEMTDAKLEAYLRQHKFDPESVHPQMLEWAVGDVLDAAYERFLPPR